MTENIIQEPQEAQPQEGQENPTTGLNLVDIKNGIAIIDHACGEGAFKGWELINQVWGVRAKFAAFVEAVEPATDEDEAAAAANDAPVTDTVAPTVATAETATAAGAA